MGYRYPLAAECNIETQSIFITYPISRECDEGPRSKRACQQMSTATCSQPTITSMGNSPSAPPPSGSSDSKRGSSFSFSLRLKRPRAQLDQQYDEGATLPVIAPLSERRPSTPLTPGAPETSQGVLSEEDEVENILDTPRDHSPTIPQTPPIINPGPTIGKKREEVSTVRTSSAAEPDHHNKGNATVSGFH